MMPSLMFSIRRRLFIGMKPVVMSTEMMNDGWRVDRTQAARQRVCHICTCLK